MARGKTEGSRTKKRVRLFVERRWIDPDNLAHDLRGASVVRFGEEHGELLSSREGCAGLDEGRTIAQVEGEIPSVVIVLDVINENVAGQLTVYLSIYPVS